MTAELTALGQTGLTTYALIKRKDGQFWNQNGWEAYTTLNRGTYRVGMNEQGTASGIYEGDFPTAITDSGTYEYFVYQSPDANVHETDNFASGGTVDWTGVSLISVSSGSMSASDFAAYVKRTFKRDDKDTELYEAMTDAIQIMRRKFAFDEAEVDASSTATITTLGQYKFATESNLGLLMGVILEDRSIAFPLVQLSKSQYDALYPYAALNIIRGYPQHYCVYAGSIYVGPVPDRTTYNYRLTWSQRGGTITSATTAVPFTNLYRDVLKSYTLAELNETLEKFDTAQYWRGKGDVGFMDAVSRERKNDGSGTFMVRPFNLT